MTDKTDLIERIKLHVGFMKAADNPVSDHYHLKEIKRLCIKQACEAVSIEETSAGPRLFFNDQLVRSWLGTVYNDDAYALVDKLKQAIRDRFEGEK